MRRLIAATAAAVLLSATVAFAADPIGNYEVAGANPAGKDS